MSTNDFFQNAREMTGLGKLIGAMDQTSETGKISEGMKLEPGKNRASFVNFVKHIENKALTGHPRIAYIELEQAIASEKYTSSLYSFGDQPNAESKLRTDLLYTMREDLREMAMTGNVAKKMDWLQILNNNSNSLSSRFATRATDNAAPGTSEFGHGMFHNPNQRTMALAA